jgi:hypothetical protein
MGSSFAGYAPADKGATSVAGVVNHGMPDDTLILDVYGKPVEA